MGATCSTYDSDLKKGNNPRDPGINKCTIETPVGKQNGIIKPVNTCYSQNDRSTNASGSDFCRFIGDVKGDVSEWREKRGTSSCYYWDKSTGKNMALKASEDLGCCDGGCVLVGEFRECERVRYFGDPVLCCFKDFACNSDDDKCFQTPDRLRTCDPKHRDLNSNICRSTIEPYCTGEKTFPGTDWKDLWKNVNVNVNANMINESKEKPPLKYTTETITKDSKSVSEFKGRGEIYNYDANALSPRDRGIKYPENQKQPCLRAIVRGLTNANVCTYEDLRDLTVVEGNLNMEAFQWSKGVIDSIFKRYSEETNSESPIDEIRGDKVFENNLFEICSKIPSLCTDGLTKWCKGYKKDALRKDKNLQRWCGCYLDSSEYKKDFGDVITRECQDTCVNQNSIPVVGRNLLPKYCVQNVCQITRAKLELLTTEGGTFNFSQLCPGCGRSVEKYTYKDGYYFLDERVVGDVRENLEINLEPGEYNVLISPVLGMCNEFNNVEDLPTGKITVSDGKITNFVYENKGTNRFNEICLPSKTTEQNQKIEMQINKTYTKTFENNLPGFETTDITPENREKPASLVFLAKEYKRIVRKIVGDDNQNSEQVEKNFNNYYSYQSDINRCSCSLSDVDISFVNSKINGTFNVNDVCGRVDCTDQDNNLVDCGGDGDRIVTLEEALKEEAQEEIKEKYNNIASVLLISLIFLFFIMYIFSVVYNGVRAFIKK